LKGGKLERSLIVVRKMKRDVEWRVLDPSMEDNGKDWGEEKDRLCQTLQLVLEKKRPPKKRARRRKGIVWKGVVKGKKNPVSTTTCAERGKIGWGVSVIASLMSQREKELEKRDNLWGGGKKEKTPRQPDCGENHEEETNTPEPRKNTIKKRNAEMTASN